MTCCRWRVEFAHINKKIRNVIGRHEPVIRRSRDKCMWVCVCVVECLKQTSGREKKLNKHFVWSRWGEREKKDENERNSHIFIYIIHTTCIDLYAIYTIYNIHIRYYILFNKCFCVCAQKAESTSQHFWTKYINAHFTQAFISTSCAYLPWNEKETLKRRWNIIIVNYYYN